MCGIAGYIGPRPAVEVVYDQLKRLEYRGYDSAGIAFYDGKQIQVVKRAGKLNQLGEALENSYPDCHLAMGHSRWATHGAPTNENAHPHYDQTEQVAIIHNGIIENYLELKEELAGQGSIFKSDTDTEVAAHLIGAEFASGCSLEDAVCRAVKKLRGAYSLVIMSHKEPDKIIAARNASPLVIGIGEGENMLASDIPALLPYTRNTVILEDDQVAILTQNAVIIKDLEGRIVQPEMRVIDWDIDAAEKGGYEHFMLKEIHEQPAVIRQCLAGRIDDKNHIRLENVFGESVWNEVNRLAIVACGTSYHAGLMGKALFEKLLRLPTDVYFSSEFRYGDPVLLPGTLCLFISQSGETADTLAALKLAKERRIRTLGLVNVIGSSIARECDRAIITQAGPEISVASTKAYVAQVTALILLMLHVAQVKEMPGIRVEQAVLELKKLDSCIEEVFKKEQEIIDMAGKLSEASLVFFLGRGLDANVAFEGALKLKEIAYIATQESPAGEMKHGPLALVQEGVFAVMGATDSNVREKLASNIKEMQARGGTVIAITTEADTTIEKSADYTLKFEGLKLDYLNALVSMVVLQLLSYHTARIKGCEIDQPRNLAKSVTVE